MPNTIVLKGRGIRKEGVAGGTITPGMFLERTTTVDQVIVHNSAEENIQKLIAVEDELQGKGIDDDYLTGVNVLFEALVPGQEVNALVQDGTAAIVAGEFLQSDGAGMVIGVITAAATTELERVSTIGVALEAVDNSGGGAPVRIKVEVL